MSSPRPAPYCGLTSFSGCQCGSALSDSGRYFRLLWLGANDTLMEVRLTLGSRPSIYTVVIVLGGVTDCTFLFRNCSCSLSDIWSRASCKSRWSKETPLRLELGVSSLLLGRPPFPPPLSPPPPGGLRRGCLPPCIGRRIGVDETGPPTEGTGHKPGWYTNPEVTRFVDDEEEASNCQKWSGIEVKARETLGLRYWSPARGVLVAILKPPSTLVSDSIAIPDHWVTETVCPSFSNLSAYVFRVNVNEHLTDALDSLRLPLTTSTSS